MVILLLNVFAINRLIHIIAQIVWRICHQQKPKLKKTGELSLVSGKKISLLPFPSPFSHRIAYSFDQFYFVLKSYLVHVFLLLFSEL